MGKSTIHCPDCHSQCVLVTVKDCRLDTCTKCHGVWLDAGEVLRVRDLFPEDSPIVDAEQNRVAGKKVAKTRAAMSVVEMVGDLFLLITL